MSGKFRHNNRKYRVAGSAGGASATPTSANGRPSAARSSDEEDYQSDFDRFEADQEDGNMFVVGEAITDQLQLSSEFESDIAVEDTTEGEGDEVKEEEGLQVSPPSRPGAKTVTGSAMEHDSDEIDEYYESDFSSVVSPNRGRGDTAESDIYDESFEQGSPKQRENIPRAGEKKKKQPRSKVDKENSGANGNINTSNKTRGNDAKIAIGSLNQEESSDCQNSEEAIINHLSEFSSITFADDHSVVTDETSILLGNNVIGQPSNERKSKAKKSKSSHVSWKSADQGNNSCSKHTSNNNSKITKKGSNGIPIPTQPRSRPSSQATGGVAMASSSSAANSPTSGTNKSLVSANNPKRTSVSQPISGSSKLGGKSSTSVSSATSANTQLPTMKFQAIKITTSTTSTAVGAQLSVNGGGSVVTQGSSLAGKASVVSGGGGSHLSVPHQNPVTSTVGQRNSLPANELQRQLTLTLRRLDEYKQQNLELREQLDGSTIYAIIEKLKHEMVDKDQRIQALVNENNALKYVSRHQGKQLVEVEIAKQYEPEMVDIQSKYLEVMNEQLKNVRNKLNLAREGEKRWQGKSEKKDHVITKLRNKLMKWKGRVKELEEELRRNSSIRDTTEPGEPPIQPPFENSISAPPSTTATSADHWAKMEKNFLLQIKSLQRDLAHKKQECQDLEKEKKLLEEELKKRELFARHQTSVIRVLRHDYEDLVEANRQLMLAAALYNRDTALPVKKEKKKVEEPIPPLIVRLEPVAVVEPVAAKAKKGMFAEDGEGNLEDENNVRDTMTFLTRMDYAEPEEDDILE